MVELFIEQIYPTFVGHSKTLEQGTTNLVDITDYDSRKIDVLEKEKKKIFKFCNNLYSILGYMYIRSG